LHALLRAAFASMENRHRPRARAAGRDCVRSHRHPVRGAGAIADTDTDAHSDAHAFTDADGDQFDGVVGGGADQSRQ
jgi:hypothetical protein